MTSSVQKRECMHDFLHFRYLFFLKKQLFHFVFLVNANLVEKVNFREAFPWINKFCACIYWIFRDRLRPLPLNNTYFTWQKNEIMGAILGTAGCAASVACCCTSTAAGLCCSACPSCRNSTSSRIMYSIFLLLTTIISCVMLSPKVEEQLEKISWLCEKVWKLLIRYLFSLGIAG